MNGRHFIYFHINPLKNNIFYVGQGLNNGREYDKHRRSKLWWRTVKKYGYIIDIPHEGLTKDQANQLEKFYINKIGRIDLKTGSLVNLTDGGEGSVNIKMSEETKKRMSLSKLGEKNFMFGKTHTPEVRQIISQTNSGVNRMPKEARERLRHINSTRYRSRSERDKLSKSLSGKPKSKAHKLALSISKSKKRIILIKGKITLEFSSFKFAADFLDRDRTTVSDAAKKGYRCNGYKVFEL